ncbi:hypothetical protein BO78DRAFT_412986 [Aspergillus sclerotiicarbonarius CBS 121057]|uniref:Uncharacterized protein n=1 Tax=Aspergillus sclerotiicarbonarius (strain CBS 121057 / IBT 28362) TaxID=1448318 RepID=A0A319F738_ASPSB|nr:hypothetical protein BO78DRAFT_412986 [Aspergillus sclerotiicarbonarius CBS 121057]
MPPEDEAEKKAAAEVAAAKMAEEQRKREDRAAVTQGLTDSATMKQLSSSGNPRLAGFLLVDLVLKIACLVILYEGFDLDIR